MICIKNEHSTCADRDILDSASFYNSAQSSIRGGLASSGSERRESLRRPFIGRMAPDPESWKQTIGEMERRLDSKITAGLKTLQEGVFRLQSQAIRENNEMGKIRLADIDYIKKKCHIKVDRQNRRLELKFRHSNKIQEYMLLSRFLNKFFEKKFAATRPQLMCFNAPARDISLAGLQKSQFLDAQFTATNNCLNVKAKKNSVWYNEQGRFNQCVLLSRPVRSALFELHVRNLSFNSTNLEVLFLNQASYDFWKKRVKLDSNEGFRDVPSLARVDFDLRRSHPVASFCRDNRELQSLEMSIGGCQRLIERASVMCSVDRPNQAVRVCGLNTLSLAHLDLSEKKGPESAEMESPTEPVVEVVADAGDEDEWEDVSEESTDNTDAEQKIPGSLRAEMTRCAKEQSLYVALIVHNEHVEATLRFHELAEDKTE